MNRNSILGAFAKLRKATTSHVMSVCLSVRLSVCMAQLCSPWTDVHDIWYLSVFRKFVEKIQVSLKSENNNWYFTQKPKYIYDNISLNSS